MRLRRPLLDADIGDDEIGSGHIHAPAGDGAHMARLGMDTQPVVADRQMALPGFDRRHVAHVNGGQIGKVKPEEYIRVRPRCRAQAELDIAQIDAPHVLGDPVARLRLDRHRPQFQKPVRRDRAHPPRDFEKPAIRLPARAPRQAQHLAPVAQPEIPDRERERIKIKPQIRRRALKDHRLGIKPGGVGRDLADADLRLQRGGPARSHVQKPRAPLGAGGAPVALDRYFGKVDLLAVGKIGEVAARRPERDRRGRLVGAQRARPDLKRRAQRAKLPIGPDACAQRARNRGIQRPQKGQRRRLPGQFLCRDILEPDAELCARPVQIAAVIHLKAGGVFARAQHRHIAAQRDLAAAPLQQGLPAIGGPCPPAARILIAQAHVGGLYPRQFCKHRAR